MTQMSIDRPPPTPAPGPGRIVEPEERLSGPLVGLIIVAGIVGALYAARPSTTAVPLIFPVERVAEQPRATAASITPITNLSGGASGVVLSADAYDVTCTVSGTATLMPAMHDGSAWSVFSGFSCSLDSSVVARSSCPFPAKRGGGLTFNAYKTGSGTVSNCTAEARSGPLPSSRGSQSSGAVADQDPNLVFAGPASGGAAPPTFRGLVAADIPNINASKIDAGTLAFARLPAIYPGASFAYTSVNIGAGRYPVAIGVQTGGASGTTTASSAYHLYLPAFTTWRLQMITSYSYGGGGTMRGSVRTASAWGGTYSEAAFVTTTSGGVNSVFSTDFIVGGSPLVAIFECYHASNAINNVILRFFQVG